MKNVADLKLKIEVFIGVNRCQYTDHTINRRYTAQKVSAVVSGSIYTRIRRIPDIHYSQKNIPGTEFTKDT